MKAFERRDLVINELYRHKKVHVADLAQKFGVSEETIRRDLDRLEKEGRLRKVYGGAVRIRSESHEPAFMKRAQMHLQDKQVIGRLAASLIQDGETVILDNGTTTLEIMRALKDRTQVTVITNSVPVLNCALEQFAGKVIFAGGEVNAGYQAAVGGTAHDLLGQFKVNKAFISAGGISLSEGITDYHLEEALISRKMMERAEESILVADHSKLGITTFAQIAPLEHISMVLTDSGCSAEWKDTFARLDIELLTGS